MTDFFPAPEQSRQQLSKDVATYVRELIVSGRLRRGEFLRIETVAKAMGISNTPVREGLLLLQSENFVRLIPRRGFMVAGFSRQDVRDLFWAQSQLAGELAARAALRITKSELAAIHDIQDRHEKAVAARDLPAYAKTGHEFHRGINLAARSKRLAMLLGLMTKQLPNRFYATLEGQLKETLHYHPRILEAIGEKDAEKARELMRQHVATAGDYLIEVLEQQGMWADQDHENEEEAVEIVRKGRVPA